MALARPYGAACRVEIDARLGRVPPALPSDGDLGGREISLEGRAWLDRMRGRSVVPEAGPDRAVVAGAPRGAVRSLLGRRAQGFDRVLQLARTRRGKVAAAVSSRLLAWGTSGGPGRLRAAGLVLGGSRHLMAGLVRAGADPIAVAAASSRGAARAIAAGAPGSLADGARPSDHRRLVQVAEELDRRQRGAELTAATSAAARAARLDRWADCRGRRGEVPEMLKALHADRHQAITEACSRESCRAAEARRSGDADFDFLRERVREGGVRVWAQAWQGRGTESFDGRRWLFDGSRAHADGAGAPGSPAAGVKAMLLVSGGRVRHSRGCPPAGREGPRGGRARGSRRRAAAVGPHLRGREGDRRGAQPLDGAGQPRGRRPLRHARVVDGRAPRRDVRAAGGDPRRGAGPRER